MPSDTADALFTPVSRADLAVVTSPDPFHVTGYEGVFRRAERDRVRVLYAAKAFKRWVGPGRETPREAAEDVVRWWKEAFGDGWAAVFRHRRSNQFTLIRDGGGWRVLAFVRGRPVYVGSRRAARGDWYPTVAAARRAFGRWRQDTFGADAHLWVRRTARLA